MAWAGPIEGLLTEDWAPATRWFPGPLLTTFIVEDPAVPIGRAILTLGAYLAVGLTIAGIDLVRRDVTS